MKLNKRSNGIYMLRWNENGKDRRVSTSTKDKKAAEAWARDFLAGKSSAQRCGSGMSPFTLEDALWETYEQVWRKGRGFIEQESLIRRVIKDIGQWRMDGITAAMIKQYRNDLGAKGLSASTVNKRLSAISKAFDVAIEDDKISANAKPLIKRLSSKKAKPKYFTEAEEMAIYEAAKDAPFPKGENAIMLSLIDVLAGTGARLSEALRMRKQSIDEGHVFIDYTKNGKDRWVPLTERAERSLRYLLDDLKWQSWVQGCRYDEHGDMEPHSEEAIAAAQRNLKQARDKIQCRFRCIKFRAGVPHGTLHKYRHTVASRMLQAGGRIEVVSAHLGHTNINTTQIYAHLAKKDLTANRELIASMERKDHAPDNVVSLNRRVKSG